MKKSLRQHLILVIFLLGFGVLLMACQARPAAVHPTEVMATAANGVTFPTPAPNNQANSGSGVTTGLPVLDGILSCIGELLLMVAVVGIPLWLVIRAGKKEHKQEESLLKQATAGQAKVIEVGASRTGRSDQKTHVALRLEVTPETGQPFKTITSWVVEPAHIAGIQVGSMLAVKIVEMPVGKSKTKKFNSVFPAVAWAKLYYWEQEFTEATMKTIDDEDTYIE